MFHEIIKFTHEDTQRANNINVELHLNDNYLMICGGFGALTIASATLLEVIESVDGDSGNARVSIRQIGPDEQLGQGDFELTVDSYICHLPARVFAELKQKLMTHGDDIRSMAKEIQR